MVDDLHTAYWPKWEGGLRAEGSFIELTKSLIDELHAEFTYGELKPTAFTRSTLSIHVYNSIIAFERDINGSKKVRRSPAVPQNT